MVALNFKKQFAGDIETRKKRRTLRKSCRAKPGDKLQLYTGMRSKSCRKLTEDATCTKVSIVLIYNHFLMINGIEMPDKARTKFAQLDGFESVTAFVQFFDDLYGLPIKLFMIEWGWPDACQQGLASDASAAPAALERPKKKVIPNAWT